MRWSYDRSPSLKSESFSFLGDSNVILKPRAISLLVSDQTKHLVHLRSAPSRSCQNWEKDAFSDSSSSTTSNLGPALLIACTRPNRARTRR